MHEQSLAGEGLAVLVERTAELLRTVAQSVHLEQRVSQVLTRLTEEQREKTVRQRQALRTRRLPGGGVVWMTCYLAVPRWGIHGCCPPLRGGGEGGFRSPAICQTSGPIIYSKTAFDSPGHKLSECTAKF